MYRNMHERKLDYIKAIGFWLMVNVIVYHVAVGLSHYVLDYLSK